MDPYRKARLLDERDQYHQAVPIPTPQRPEAIGWGGRPKAAWLSYRVHDLGQGGVSGEFDCARSLVEAL